MFFFYKFENFYINLIIKVTAVKYLRGTSGAGFGAYFLLFRNKRRVATDDRRSRQKHDKTLSRVL